MASRISNLAEKDTGSEVGFNLTPCCQMLVNPSKAPTV